MVDEWIYNNNMNNIIKRNISNILNAIHAYVLAHCRKYIHVEVKRFNKCINGNKINADENIEIKQSRVISGTKTINKNSKRSP